VLLWSENIPAKHGGFQSNLVHTWTSL